MNIYRLNLFKYHWGLLSVLLITIIYNRALTVPPFDIFWPILFIFSLESISFSRYTKQFREKVVREIINKVDIHYLRLFSATYNEF